MALVVAGALVTGPGTGSALASTDRHTMLTLTNESRARHDRAALKFDRQLSSYAQRHSRQMARRGKLVHTRDMADKLKGIRWHTWGENIGESPTTLEELQQAFMDSKLHRKNILNRAFHHVAIGVVQVKGTYWVTVIFYG